MNLLHFYTFVITNLKLKLTPNLIIKTIPQKKILIIQGLYGFVIFHYSILEYLISTPNFNDLIFFKTFLSNLFYRLNVKKKKLILIKGVGFKFEIKKTNKKNTQYLKLKAGYNSPIIFKFKNNTFKVKVPKPTRLLIQSLNYQNLYLFLKYIKQYRIPDVYKNKGMRFRFEKLRKKIVRKSK